MGVMWMDGGYVCCCIDRTGGKEGGIGGTGVI